MDPNMLSCILPKHTEPEDKYGVQFEYHDLYQRLILVKRQREQQSYEKVNQSLDKGPKKSPPSRNTRRNRSGVSLRSNSIVKSSSRAISTDIKKLFKIYSPSPKQKLVTPDKVISSIKFPNIIHKQNAMKRVIRLNRLKS